MLVRVALPMYVGGIRREVGEIVDLPPVDAVGAIHRGRAERIQEPKEQAPAAPVPSPGPMTTESAPEMVPGKKRKYAQKETQNVVS